MRIEVTRQDVAEGRQCHATCCPVARAVARAVGPGSECIAVTVEVAVVLLHGDRLHNVGLPFGVGERIAEYDREGKMEPFSFELPLEVPQ